MLIGTYKHHQLDYLRQRWPDRLADVDRLIGTPDERGRVRIDTHGDLWRELHGQPPLPAKPHQTYAAASTPAKPRLPLPGDAMAAIFTAMGYHKTAGCGCGSMQAQMNAWGWIGCWRQRKALTTWFAAKARESGMTLSDDQVWRIVWGEIKRQFKVGRTAV